MTTNTERLWKQAKKDAEQVVKDWKTAAGLGQLSPFKCFLLQCFVTRAIVNACKQYAQTEVRVDAGVVNEQLGEPWLVTRQAIDAIASAHALAAAFDSDGHLRVTRITDAMYNTLLAVERGELAWVERADDEPNYPSCVADMIAQKIITVHTDFSFVGYSGKYAELTDYGKAIFGAERARRTPDSRVGDRIADYKTAAGITNPVAGPNNEAAMIRELFTVLDVVSNGNVRVNFHPTKGEPLEPEWLCLYRNTIRRALNNGLLRYKALFSEWPTGGTRYGVFLTVKGETALAKERLRRQQDGRKT